MTTENQLIYFCYPCSRQQKYQIATYYCRNCGRNGAFVCWQCKRQHEKFEVLGTHDIQAISGKCSSKENECSCPNTYMKYKESGQREHIRYRFLIT